MKKVLPDVCNIQYGYAFDSAKFSSDQGVPLIRIRDVVRGFSETYTTEECSEEYIVNNGDILIGMDGEFNIAQWHGGKAYLNQRVCRLIPKDEINPLYLFYFMPRALKTIEDKTPFVTVKHLSAKELNKIVVPVPTLREQKEISSSLQKLDELISLRKQQLSKLDDLVKSRFIEGFGDPIRNTQNRPTTDFINVVKMQRGFDLPVQDRQQDGDIPVFGSNGALDRHNVAKVQGGGVITGRSGTIGKVYYTEGDYWPLNTSLFSVDTHGNNIIYLAYLLQMYDLSRFTEGTGVPTLNRNKFHNKPIIDVPLSEQELFASFVKQTDKSKLAIQKSLDQLETLKKSLMQKYFG